MGEVGSEHTQPPSHSGDAAEGAGGHIPRRGQRQGRAWAAARSRLDVPDGKPVLLSTVSAEPIQ